VSTTARARKAGVHDSVSSPGGGSTGLATAATDQLASQDPGDAGQDDWVPDASAVSVLGLSYVHSVTQDGGDLYLTDYGLKFWRQLQPENWFEPDWFMPHRERLDGSALVYALPTKLVAGESVPLVVKYCRVGEKVPIDTEVIEGATCCEFNGPFEEFSLLEDLRTNPRGPAVLRVKTQRPLAIYVPPERWQPSQLQRFQWRIARKLALHPGVAIDIMREYIMVYQWLPGIDSLQARQMGFLTEAEMVQLGAQANADLQAKGFRVLDMKAAHVIVQVTGRGGVRRADGGIEFGLVDFELLERTREYYQEIQDARRAYYQRRRAIADSTGTERRLRAAYPCGRHATRIFSVEYVHGRVESTGGMLWIVGNDPELFDYFLPERWRTAIQERLVTTHDTFFTTSKDKIEMVWKVSRVGERVEVAAFGPEGFKALAHGFNSPFEEVSLARRLRLRGVPCISPLAIYRTGSLSQFSEARFDASRFRSHGQLLDCEGEPILQADYNYISIWEPWSCSGDEDSPPRQTFNAAQAVARHLISSEESSSLVAAYRSRLLDLGVEVMRLSPAHILLAADEEDRIVSDAEGAPETCLCNFQHLGWSEE